MWSISSFNDCDSLCKACRIKRIPLYAIQQIRCFPSVRARLTERPAILSNLWNLPSAFCAVPSFICWFIPTKPSRGTGWLHCMFEIPLCTAILHINLKPVPLVIYKTPPPLTFNEGNIYYVGINNNDTLFILWKSNHTFVQTKYTKFVKRFTISCYT